MKRKNQVDGCYVYQAGERGYGYNRSLREWELYDMHEDGSIQDLCDRVKTRAEAEEWARASDVIDMRSEIAESRAAMQFFAAERQPNAAI